MIDNLKLLSLKHGNKKIIAVYLITQKYQQKHYIGYSIDVLKRFSAHRNMLRRNDHHCIHLQRAWNLYGGDSFDFHIMKIFNNINDAVDFEQLFLENLDNFFYNIADSNDPKDIIRFVLTKDAIKKGSETKKKSQKFLISLAKNREKAYTKEARAKRIATLKKNGLCGKAARKKIIAINIKTNEKLFFDSIKEASDILKISKGNICMCCKSTRKSASGYLFQYNPNQNDAKERKMMESNLDIDVLCKAMFIAHNEYVKNNYYEPEMTVTFSPIGYAKIRSCTNAKMLFSPYTCEDAGMVNGYPFSVEITQKEDFIVNVNPKKLTKG